MYWMSFIDPSRVLIFTLIFVRVSGIVLMAPVFGGQDIPARFRALFAFTLALVILPSQWFTPIAEPLTLPGYLIYILGELVIGLSLGVGISILFSGLQIAGDLISRMGGLSASQLYDPTSGETVPLLGLLIHSLGITVFAAVGGLRLLIGGLLDTFQTIPIGSDLIRAGVATGLVDIGAMSFSLAFRISAPVTAAVLVAMLVMGLLGRTLPQLNLMSVGFGINTVIMFAILYLTIGASILCFQEQIYNTLDILFAGFFVKISPENL